MAVPSTAAPIPRRNPSLVFRSAWAGAVVRQMNITTAVVIEINVFIFHSPVCMLRVNPDSCKDKNASFFTRTDTGKRKMFTKFLVAHTCQRVFNTGTGSIR
jgi:hypothetical protein